MPSPSSAAAMASSTRPPNKEFIQRACRACSRIESSPSDARSVSLSTRRVDRSKLPRWPWKMESPKSSRELFGGGGARHHQLGGARVGTLHLGCAQPAQREERDPELQLQLGFGARALVAFGEPAQQVDRAGEVFDCALVRGEPHRPQPGARGAPASRGRRRRSRPHPRAPVVERGEVVVSQELGVVLRTRPAIRSIQPRGGAARPCARAGSRRRRRREAARGGTRTPCRPRPTSGARVERTPSARATAEARRRRSVTRRRSPRARRARRPFQRWRRPAAAASRRRLAIQARSDDAVQALGHLLEPAVLDQDPAELLRVERIAADASEQSLLPRPEPPAAPAARRRGVSCRSRTREGARS